MSEILDGPGWMKNKIEPDWFCFFKGHGLHGQKSDTGKEVHSLTIRMMNGLTIRLAIRIIQYVCRRSTVYLKHLEPYDKAHKRALVTRK